MLELYGFTRSRWVKCYWMLKELGQEFKPIDLDFYKSEQKSPEILAMNPFGKVPILKDGSNVIFESNAILNYLGEKFPESGLVPKSGSIERAYYDQWLFFSSTELEQPLWRITKHLRILPENLRLPQEIELATMDFKNTVKIFDEWLGDKTYLVNKQFTAVDIAMAYTLKWSQSLQLLSGFANCEHYLANLLARPAFPKELY